MNSALFEIIQEYKLTGRSNYETSQLSKVIRLGKLENITNTLLPSSIPTHSVSISPSLSKSVYISISRFFDSDAVFGALKSIGKLAVRWLGHLASSCTALLVV